MITNITNPMISKSASKIPTTSAMITPTEGPCEEELLLGFTGGVVAATVGVGVLAAPTVSCAVAESAGVEAFGSISEVAVMEIEPTSEACGTYCAVKAPVASGGYVPMLWVVPSDCIAFTVTFCTPTKFAPVIVTD